MGGNRFRSETASVVSGPPQRSPAVELVRRGPGNTLIPLNVIGVRDAEACPQQHTQWSP